MLEKEIRPWGSFEVLKDEISFKLKRIDVLPGKRLSYQSHKFREENWVVIQGIATVILEDKIIKLLPGNSIFIPIESKHRLQNDSNEILSIIEVQTGTYFGEDDIIRYEDDFNRK